MDSQSYGRAFGDAIGCALVLSVVAGGVASVCLWELFWWLWEHVAITWA